VIHLNHQIAVLITSETPNAIKEKIKVPTDGPPRVCERVHTLKKRDTSVAAGAIHKRARISIDLVLSIVGISSSNPSIMNVLKKDDYYNLFVFGGLSIKDTIALISTNRRLHELYNDPMVWESLFYSKVKKTTFRKNKKDVEEWNFFDAYPAAIRLRGIVFSQHFQVIWTLSDTKHAFRIDTRFNGVTEYVIKPNVESEPVMRYITATFGENMIITNHRVLVVCYYKFLADGWIPSLPYNQTPRMLTECAICGSVATSECGNNCGTVYCGEKCGITHWNDSHWRECSN